MSTRYLGGIVRKTPLVLDPALGNAANGVFTMSQYMQAIKNATWPSYDPYFNETVLLLHGNGTNGAQNNTFLDSSTNNFTITRNGNTTQGTFSPFSVGAGEWSNYFDGTGDFLAFPDNTAFNFGTGSFTVECWIYRAGTGSGTSVYESIIGGNDIASYWNLYVNSSNNTIMWFGNDGITRSTSNTINNNTWNHIVATRSGSTLKIFINGVEGYSATVTTSYSLGTTGGRIGFDGPSNSTGNKHFFGYISNIRVLKGTGYSTITVPTTPLTAITNTSLLTCQSNRFVDNSTNAFTITRNGDVRVTPFSPFAPTAAYSADTNGGSGYFDGSGDRLTLTNNSAFDMGSGNFTIECWFYMTGNSPQNADGNRTANLFVAFPDSATPVDTLSLGFGGNSTTTGTSIGFSRRASGVVTSVAYTATITQQTWHHVAVVRSGSNLTLYYDGVQVAQDTSFSGNADTGGNPIKIGALGYFPSGANYEQPFVGYISGLKVIKGTAVTPSGVPTSPPVNSSGTSLLCNFTNAGIIDNTGKNVLETVGNAQIDTTTKKYGTGSLEFDGSGDYLIAPTSNDLAFGTGDFTIEAWVYTSSQALNNSTILSNGYNSFQAGCAFLQNPGTSAGTVGERRRIKFGTQATNPILLGTTQLNTGEWYHIAITRSGTTMRLFVNGTVEDTETNSESINFSTNGMVVGTALWDGASGFWNGYIDDFRITKGVARYTANFTPQTSQWQDQ